MIPQLPLEVAIIKACGYQIESDKKAKEAAPRAVVTATKMTVNKEAITNAASESNLDLETIKTNWQRIVDQIETPFIRMSFIDGEPVKYENNDLYMTFNSGTLMEKVAKSSNQVVIQKAFQTVFGSKINLNLSIKKVSLEPINETSEKKEDPSLMKMAQEVFGS